MSASWNVRPYQSLRNLSVCYIRGRRASRPSSARIAHGTLENQQREAAPETGPLQPSCSGSRHRLHPPPLGDLLSTDSWVLPGLPVSESWELENDGWTPDLQHAPQATPVGSKSGKSQACRMVSEGGQSLAAPGSGALAAPGAEGHSVRPAFTPVLPAPDPGLLPLCSALSFSPWPWQAGGPGSGQRNVLENGLSVAVRWDSWCWPATTGLRKTLLGESGPKRPETAQSISEEVSLAKAARGLVRDRAEGCEGWTRWGLDGLAGGAGRELSGCHDFILEQLLRMPHYF